MPKENKTQYVILGMLSTGEKSGYEIRKDMQQSTQNFWYESNGQLYPTLAKLCAEGAISAKNIQADPKSKKTYSITKMGQKKFKHWLQRDVDYKPMRSELLLKIFFGENVAADNSIQLLNKHRSMLESKLEKSKTVEVMLQQHVDRGEYPINYSLTVKFGIKVIAAEIEWCAEAIKLIEQYAVSDA